MVAALRTLAQMPARGSAIAVLGRMGELGAESERGHRRVGEAAGTLKIDCVVGVGAEAAWIAQSAREHGVTQVLQVRLDEGGRGLSARAGAAGRRAARQREPVARAWNKSWRDWPRHDVLSFTSGSENTTRRTRTGRCRDVLKALNVLQYITFRAMGAAVTAFLLSLIFGDRVIRRLISLKIGQPIRTKEEVAEALRTARRQARHADHGRRAAAGLGGRFHAPLGALDNAARLARDCSPSLYLGVIGFIDDYLKVAKKKSEGRQRPARSSSRSSRSRRS